MDYSRIKILLDKYWKCESSLEEEAELREFFAKDNLPAEFEPYAPMFRFFGKIAQMEPAAEFRATETVANPAHDIKITHRYGTGIQWLYRVAAVLLLILSVIFIHDRIITVRKKAVEFTRDTYSNPKQALDETRKMLMLISVKLNKGEEQAAKLYEFHEAENMIRNKNK